MVTLLESAIPEIQFDNYDDWNGGRCYYSLHLMIPRKVFAKIEDRIEALQKTIGSKLLTVFKKTDPHFLTSVVISPQIVSYAAKSDVPPPTDAVKRIWGAGRLRVFLSHVSSHKREVARLKECLRIYGISAFVAHEDIKPTREWQREIETALNTMHILAAILTPDFKNSLWTDQEVGYAIGRGIKTIPIRTGALPHGLLGTQQALRGDLAEPSILARDLVKLVLEDGDLQPRMQEALISALAESSGWADSKSVVAQLETCRHFTSDQLQAISRSLRDNSQVRDAFGVPAKLKALISKHSPQEEKDEVPF